jgi:hypothetical protein
MKSFVLLNTIFDYRAKKVSELLGGPGVLMSDAGGSLLSFVTISRSSRRELCTRRPCR